MNIETYTYNSASGTMASINPLRYRGYYCDSESGFYYLQSRYYDPAIGRFINADSFASTGQNFMGYNMFAYCGNNPIMHQDATGSMFGAIALVAAAFWGGALVGYGLGKETEKEKALIKSGGPICTTVE